MNADMKWLDNPEVFKVNQLASIVIIPTIGLFGHEKRENPFIPVIKWAVGILLLVKM